MRERNYSRFPSLADWLSSEERRKKFIKWVDGVLELEGNWLRDDPIGLEFRVELYIEWLLRKGWTPARAVAEEKRLRKYIEGFG